MVWIPEARPAIGDRLRGEDRDVTALIAEIDVVVGSEAGANGYLKGWRQLEHDAGPAAAGLNAARRVAVWRRAHRPVVDRTYCSVVTSG